MADGVTYLILDDAIPLQGKEAVVDSGVVFRNLRGSSWPVQHFSSPQRQRGSLLPLNASTVTNIIPRRSRSVSASLSNRRFSKDPINQLFLSTRQPIFRQSSTFVQIVPRRGGPTGFDNRRRRSEDMQSSFACQLTTRGGRGRSRHGSQGRAVVSRHVTDANLRLCGDRQGGSQRGVSHGLFAAVKMLQPAPGMHDQPA